MVRLILITLIASAFFSSTYILNELMSNSGGALVLVGKPALLIHAYYPYCDHCSTKWGKAY